MKVILQVSTGLFGRCTVEEPDTALRRLEDLFRRLPVRGVIYGWGRREGLFERILEVTHGHGAEAWLWLPAFADVRDPEDADPMIYYGTKNENPVRTCPGEEFHFVCPASIRNRAALRDAFEELTAGCAPDGVFLDRIRYPSAVRSPAHFFGCRCSACRERQKEAGVDPRVFQDRIGRADRLDEALPDRLENGRYHYRDPDLECVMAAKRKTITEAVGQYCHTFHQRGIRVGIDTFAPALADLVGQDLRALLPLVDLVKPMMYFRTFAPAGIPYELHAYGKAFSDRLSTLWGGRTDDPRSMETQLRSLPDGKDKICPGLEINRVPGICEPDADRLREAVRAVKAAGCDTIVLSWNVLQAREEEIRAVETALSV